MKVGLFAYNWEADTSLALWNLVTFARQEPLIAQRVEFQEYCAATPKSAYGASVHDRQRREGFSNACPLRLIYIPACPRAAGNILGAAA